MQIKVDLIGSKKPKTIQADQTPDKLAIEAEQIIRRSYAQRAESQASSITRTD